MFLKFVRGLHSSSQGLRIRVGNTQTAGRAVFATNAIAMGELIHTTEPLFAHPTLSNIEKVCYFCLRRLETMKQTRRWNAIPWLKQYDAKKCTSFDKVNNKESNGRIINHDHFLDSGHDYFFCSEDCKELAMGFMEIESRGNWSKFHTHCRKNKLKFPLLAKRFACMVAYGSLPPDALDILCCLNASNGIPALWLEERNVLRNTLVEAGVSAKRLSFLTDDWYAGVLGRLYLNVFRVEMVNTSLEDILEAAADSLTGEGISGSAVYILLSMYNHDCDPNVDVSWVDTATANVKARRDIEPGEELRITYIDASLPWESRQTLLQQAYGFVCSCPRCLERD